jgi:hypothetical protein
MVNEKETTFKGHLKGDTETSIFGEAAKKDDNPIPKDVVKAAANVSGELFTYNQGYRVIKAKDGEIDRGAMFSFHLVVPYLQQFKELNPGLEVTKLFCRCGLWQEYGITCVDAMTYYRQIEQKTW